MQQKRRRKTQGNVVKVDFRRAWTAYRIPVYVLGAVLLAVWAAYPITTRMQQKNQIAQLEKAISDLKEENQSIKQEIARLKTDDYVEEIARRDLGLAKPDEEVYIVYGADETATPKPAKKAPAPKNPSLWERLLDLFGL